MRYKVLSEGAIRRFPKLDHDEPFADVKALAQVTSLSESYILECCSLGKLDSSKGSRTHPLKAHKLCLGIKVDVVFCFSEIKSWLLLKNQSMPADLAEGVAKNACYRTANRRIRGLGTRSLVSQSAHRAYVLRFNQTQEVPV